MQAGGGADANRDKNMKLTGACELRDGIGQFVSDPLTLSRALPTGQIEEGKQIADIVLS